MKPANSIYIAGNPGTGKTIGVAKIITDLGLKACVVDFENKFHKTIRAHFPEKADSFELYLGYVKRETSSTEIKKTSNGKMNKSSTEGIGFKNTPDWEKSYDYLIEIVEMLIDRTDYDVLIFDGASQTLRNDLGVAKWKLDNPGRDQPLQKEWAPMNDIEAMFLNGGKDWADEYDKLFIVTGQMKEDFKKDVKVGETPALTMKLQHKMDVSLMLEKTFEEKKPVYVCTCLDSVIGQWKETLTMDRHLLDILVEKELIGYD
jgi:hypothetical protein